MSEEERTETASEGPRKDTHEDHDDRESRHIQEPRAGTSNHRSDDILSQRFDSISNKYFDKSFVV